MKISIISTCTGSKAHEVPNQLTLADFQAGKAHFEARRREVASFGLSAGCMYTGEHHVHLMRGVAAARASGHQVDVHIISAGFGVLAENDEIVPYDATFNDMEKHDCIEWGRELRIPERVQEILSEPADMSLVLLSEKYLNAANVDAIKEVAGPTWAICASSAVKRFSPSIQKVPLVQADTKRFHTTMIGLKGAVAALVLAARNPLAELRSLSSDPRQLSLL
ncbi:DUF6884 domain-containing protein [Noviherbaspirillum galbum]|uniref:DUF6884 domain-containing protein n=1 Tax=Noviherbaspirillum galbum TaxID=2709383 RepID=A0A6B3SGZ6_9BURK|nr:DUF6884 domain-containing protein [Noviherbaspirillum galbum]NEX60147.1 hypothetical protein [Noviherbaspirillum galbum]